MIHSPSFRRHGVLAAVLAIIVAAAFLFADAAHPRPADAKAADLEQQVQSLVVAGSQIDVYVLDHDMEDLQWAGVIQDPLGADVAFSNWDAVGSFTQVGELNDVEEGQHTVIPASPVAPGWEVYGYRIIADGGWSDCGLNTLDYTDDPTFSVTPANPDWVVCIAVMPEGGIPGSLVTVSFVAPSVPGLWAGKLDVPAGNTDPMLNDLIGSASFTGHWHNGKAGTYWTFPTNQPKPDLWTYGFYSFESDELFPDCPSDPSVYEPSKTYFGLTEEKPHWAMCIMALTVDQMPDLRFTMKIDGPAGVDWQGTVQATGLNATWADWGVDATSTVGSRSDIDPLYHFLFPADPVAPGWYVLGYAAFESTDPDPACPADLQAYSPYSQATLSPSSPAWAVCVKVTQQAPAAGTHIEVRTGSQYGPTGWVDGPGNYDMSWLFMGVQPASSSGYRTDVPYGSYTVIGDNPPLAGSKVAGYYAMETNDVWEFCPLNDDPYSMDAGTVEVSPQHPIWTVCVLLEPVVADSRLTIRVTGQDGTNTQGSVVGPGGATWSFADWGIDNNSSMGSRTNLEEGEYDLHLGNPPKPEMHVVGYHRFQTNSSNPSCPQDISLYTMDQAWAPITEATPRWAICVHLGLDNEPQAPADVPSFDDPGMPGATTPAPTSQPTTTPTPVATQPPADPTATNEPEATPGPAQTRETPGGGSGNQGGAAGEATPIAPNTGGTPATHSPGSGALSVGLLLLALCAIAVAANQLPGRRKR